MVISFAEIIILLWLVICCALWLWQMLTFAGVLKGADLPPANDFNFSNKKDDAYYHFNI